MLDKVKAHRKALKEQKKYYGELRDLAKDPKVQRLFQRDMDVATKKMIHAFSENNVKDWNDFVKIRGEVVSLLARIQEVNGAEEIYKQIRSQIEEYYGDS